MLFRADSLSQKIQALVRHLATLLTILGILVHALLGWCPQHDHAACTQVAKKAPAAAKTTCCVGHNHSHRAPATSTNDKSDIPVDSDHSPCCDHADCLFLDGSVAGQKIVVPTLPQLQFDIVEFISAQPIPQVAGLTAPLFEPPSQAQAARVARCVWLI